MTSDPRRMPDDLFAAKRRWHEEQRRKPLEEKVRVLLRLQHDELPLLARQRPLRAWERPWPIEP
jgi:hypothetical protein